MRKRNTRNEAERERNRKLSELGGIGSRSKGNGTIPERNSAGWCGTEWWSGAKSVTVFFSSMLGRMFYITFSFTSCYYLRECRRGTLDHVKVRSTQLRVTKYVRILSFLFLSFCQKVVCCGCLCIDWSMHVDLFPCTTHFWL